MSNSQEQASRNALMNIVSHIRLFYQQNTMRSTSFRPSATLQLEGQQLRQLPPPPIEPLSDLGNDSLLNDDILPSIEANPPTHNNPYPLSRQVLNLERREREAQSKCTRLEVKCRELSLALECMTKERDEANASCEKRCQLADEKVVLMEGQMKEMKETYETKQKLSEAKLKSAVLSLNKQLKKESGKIEELLEKNLILHDKNTNLTVELATASEKNTDMEKMLEEKTLESYVFRCAYRVVFKCSLSIQEKCTIRGVLRRVIERRRAERRRDVEAQANRDQNQDEERRLESSPALESSSNPAAVTKGADSSSILLSPRSAIKRRRQLEAIEAHYKGHRAPSEESDSDSDEDMPLLDVRKKRAKKA